MHRRGSEACRNCLGKFDCHRMRCADWRPERPNAPTVFTTVERADAGAIFDSEAKPVGSQPRPCQSCLRLWVACRHIDHARLAFGTIA